MDDIVRQFKGVSDGFTRKAVGSSSSPNDASPSFSGRNLSWHADEALRHDVIKTQSSFSEYEEGEKMEPMAMMKLKLLRKLLDGIQIMN